jgi:uncharacterized protein
VPGPVARLDVKQPLAGKVRAVGSPGVRIAPRDEIHRRRDTVLRIAARHGASNVRLFGSVARGEEWPDSDVDLLIDLDAERGFDDYLGLVEELEALLHRRVDLLLARSLSPFFRPYIEADARPL